MAKKRKWNQITTNSDKKLAGWSNVLYAMGISYRIELKNVSGTKVWAIVALVNENEISELKELAKYVDECSMKFGA